MPRGFSYSRWDGTQVGFDIDADSVFKSITDDLLYHGDLNAALRRLMQQGFRDRDGKQLQGLRDVLERLRRRRRRRRSMRSRMPMTWSPFRSRKPCCIIRRRAACRSPWYRRSSVISSSTLSASSSNPTCVPSQRE